MRLNFVSCLFGIFITLLFFAPGRLGAQTVTGTVTDENNVPIPYASVGLHRSSDSSIVTGAATNEKGVFSIQTEEGSYYLKINFLSYEQKIVPNVNVEKGNVNVGKIILEASDVVLDEVEIVEEKSQMQFQLDKRVFNVGSDLTSQGSNASEILENVPSVTVDVDGNVSLRGSENVRILIDGKPSGLTGVSTNDALRQLQGNMIERVEVITNPSARYDAEGEVGIINIVLKKNQQKGVNGSFELNAGYPANFGGSFNLNFRREKFNLFTSYGLNYRRAPGSGNTIQEYFGDSTYKFTTERDHTRGDLSHNAVVGADFFLNKFNTLTLSTIYKNSTGENEANLFYRDFDEKNNLIGTTHRYDEEQEDQQNIELAASYRKTFEQKGRQLTADVKWLDSDDNEMSDIFQSVNSSPLDLTQRTSNVEDERNWLFQTDYVHPLGKEGKFETGAKSTLRLLNNDFTVEQKLSDGNFEPLSAFNNEFIYTENIHAAYVMAGNKSGKISYQGGLRAEYSDVTTELVKTNEVNNRQYLSLFPSAHFGYEINQKNNISLGYSRRLSRPHFRSLLPFFSFSDNRNFRSGNPNLNPEFTHSIDLGYLKYFNKGSVLPSIYYRHTTGEVERITVIDSTGLIRSFPINLSTENSIGLEMNFNYSPIKKWNLNGNANFFRSVSQGEYEGQLFYAEANSFQGRMSSKVTILKDLSAQLSFFYRAPQNRTQGRSLALYAFDAAIAKDVLKGFGTITLNVRDLLNSRRWRGYTYGEDFTTTSEFQWRVRQITLSFNYRINQKQDRRERRGNSGADGEEMDF